MVILPRAIQISSLTDSNLGGILSSKLSNPCRFVKFHVWFGYMTQSNCIYRCFSINMSPCKCTVVLTFWSLHRLRTRGLLTKGAHGDAYAGFLRILSLSCRILSLSSDCCCAQDFRNQRLLAPAFSLLVHCLSARCLTVFICVHAALSCPCLSPRRSSAFDIGRLDAVFFVRRGARISPAWPSFLGKTDNNFSIIDVICCFEAEP